MEDNDLRRTHDLSSHNRLRVRSAERCGCFHCLSVFDAMAVTKWIDAGQTALCPVCGVDAVLTTPPDDVSSLALQTMHKEWFGASAELIDDHANTQQRGIGLANTR